MGKKKENKISPLVVKELVKNREELYEKIKKELTPVMLKAIGCAEKAKGYKDYWDLFKELGIIFDLRMDDYERIIAELEKEGAIKKGWAACRGGFLTIKNDK
ncbi:MAG: hypothetical protein PHE59_02715 [Patescibacteria group bacterium]|nr:hypothetical protein [Patescibacteria group bacterium]MDD5164382.1 hypothetical protein [Patescibacteria group bacterium]MDD5534966.1 hypothetical protein [Patescibacteria group bacterium]